MLPIGTALGIRVQRIHYEVYHLLTRQPLLVLEHEFGR